MTICLRDTEDNTIVDCEVFESSGKVKVQLSISKSWGYAVEFKELEDKCKTMNGVSSTDDALDTVTRKLQTEIKSLGSKMNLRYNED